MYRRQASILINIIMLVDALVVIAAGYLARAFYLERYTIPWGLDEYQFAGLILLAFFLNNAVMARLGLYSDRKTTLWKTLWQTTYAIAAVFVILAALLFFSQALPVPSRLLLIFAAILFLLMTLNKTITLNIVQMLARQGFSQRHILIVGSPERSQIVFEALQKQQSWGHRIVGILRRPEDSSDPHLPLPILGTWRDLRQVIIEREIDEVILAFPPHNPHSIEPYISICERIGISVQILPAMYNPNTSALQVEVLQGVPFLYHYTFFMNASGLFYKRLLDIIAGGIGTFFTFGILYPVLGLIIKIDSPGPILFKQVRVGMNGRPFHLYKFRSMYVDAEKRKAELIDENVMNGPMFKLTNDPRITRMGRLLRRTSLDEFPQFLNVLKGQMSLVGTRPPTPEEVAQYEDWHRRRISIKPGITGLWQISGRNKITDFDEVVRLDLEYIHHWRFLDDLKILWRSIWVVLARKGAL